MNIAYDGSVTFSGRHFTRAELDEIRAIVDTFSALSRTEIAKTICDCIGWYRPNGQYKTRECYEFLGLLEERGLVSLPPVRRTKPIGTRTCIKRTSAGEPREPIEAPLKDCLPVTLSQVKEKEDRQLWQELVDRYHYLGFKVPFGAHIRYFFHINHQGTPKPAGCIQFSSPAWRISCRDKWIGWNDATRAARLQLLINNSRFLILPWIHIKNLASHVLSLSLRRVIEDWSRRYGIRPVLAETMVDPLRYHGTCYRASNWIRLGMTTGRGRMDRRNERQGASPKEVYVYPLSRNFQKLLLGV